MADHERWQQGSELCTPIVIAGDDFDTVVGQVGVHAPLKEQCKVYRRARQRKARNGMFALKAKLKENKKLLVEYCIHTRAWCVDDRFFQVQEPNTSSEVQTCFTCSYLDLTDSHPTIGLISRYPRASLAGRPSGRGLKQWR